MRHVRPMNCCNTSNTSKNVYLNNALILEQLHYLKSCHKIKYFWFSPGRAHIWPMTPQFMKFAPLLSFDLST